jgi:SSS family solute:Na+ symporter
MFSTHPLDWAVILAYFGWLVAVWLRLMRAPQGEDDYLLAGRRLTLPAFVASLVSTWYGGILGVGEYSWRYGVSNWLVFGVPYYVGALLFALLIARRARAEADLTIPDLLQRHYGRGPAIAGAVAVFITSAPAAYVLMLGTLFGAMTGLPLVPCVIAAAVFSVFYIHRGGFTSVVITDQLQFVLMYVGFGVMFAFLLAGYGGLEFIGTRVPATHFTWHGGNPWPAIVVWYVIALGTLVDPAFFQRAAAARDPGVARRGVLVSIAFWILFDFLTTSTGLYARALLPELADPVLSFPELGKLVLPPLALGLFFLGLVVTVMSTIDSYGFIAAVTIGRDVFGRLRGDAGTRVAFDVRVALWITAAFSVALALGRRSVIGLWHDLGSITTPMLLLPVGTALLGRWRLRPRWTTAAMLLPFAVTLAWVLLEDFPPPGSAGGYPLSIEPIYVGLGASLLVYAAGHAFKGGISS